ncbi:MAG: hypothetical protein ACP5UA_01365 [Candidatus Hydrogenedens sp.]
MNNTVPSGYIPLRYTQKEVPLRLPVPRFYRYRTQISKLFLSFSGKVVPLPIQELPKYELVAWPLYIVRFFLQSGTEKTQEIFIAVDAWTRTIARFERIKEIQDTPTADFQLWIKPSISLDEVKSIARYGLMHQLLRQRRLQPAPETVIPEIIFLVYTPIWACYFARTLHSLDVRLLDGYSGEKIGSQTRSAFLNALIHHHSEKSGTSY